jgi:hypothetical protein
LQLTIFAVCAIAKVRHAFTHGDTALEETVMATMFDFRNVTKVVMEKLGIWTINLFSNKSFNKIPNFSIITFVTFRKKVISKEVLLLCGCSSEALVGGKNP